MLRLFGSAFIEIDDQPHLMRLPLRAFALVALLRLSVSNVARRDQMAASLWEHSSAEHANSSMRTLVAAIRAWERTSHLQLFDISDKLISRSERHMTSDLDAFCSISEINSADALKNLLAIYRGDLFDDPGDFGPNLRQWLAIERATLRDRFVALTLSGAEQVGGPPAEAALSRVSNEFPYDDAICRAVMRHLVQHRSSTAAIEAYEQFRSRLLKDLHISPEDQTAALAREIGTQGRSRVLGPPSAEASRTPASSSLLDRPTGTMVVPRILILMPTNSQADRRERLLADAFVEDLTLSLCRLRSFAVVAPHTAVQIRQLSPVRQAVLQHVDYIIETKLRQLASGTARLDVVLVRPDTADVLWTESFAFSAADGARRLGELSDWLAGLLANTVERAEMRSLSIDTPLAAYQHYLMGRHSLRMIDLESIRRARKWFRHALYLDPDFAPAHSWLAHCLILEWMVFSHSGPELLEQAKREAQTAVDIDPLDGNGHRELGRAALFLGKMDDSLEKFSQALRYAPHHADMLADYADTLMHNSDPAAAQLRIDQALQLNPLAPDVYRWIAGGISFFSGNPTVALDHLGKMKKPDQALRLMAASAAMAGELEQANTYRKRAMANDPDFDILTWTARLPQRDRRHLDFYVEALRAAGFV